MTSPIDQSIGPNDRNSTPKRSVSKTERKLLSGASWNAFGQLTAAVSLLIVLPHLITSLGLTRYGVYSLALSGFFVLQQLDAGLLNTGTRYFSVHRGANDPAATTRLLFTLGLLLAVGFGVVAGIVALVSPHIVSLISIPSRTSNESVFLFRAIAAMLPIGLLGALVTSLLQAYGRFRLVALLSSATVVGRAIAIGVVVTGTSTLRTVGLILLGQQVALLVLLIPFALQHVSWHHRKVMPRREIRELLRYSLGVQVANISSLVNQQADALVIGSFFPVKNVGLYSTGANLAGQARGVLGNFLYPTVSHMAARFGAEGEVGARAELISLQRRWVTTCAAIFAPGAAVSYFCIRYWLGSSFHLAGVVCVILLVAYGLNMCTGMLTVYLNVIGRPEVEARYGVVSMVINIALTIPLAFVSMLGVVIATAVGTVIGSLYLVSIARRRVTRDIPNFLPLIPVVPALLGSAASIGVELLLRPFAPSGFSGLVYGALPFLPGIAVFAFTQVIANRVSARRRSLRPDVGELTE